MSGIVTIGIVSYRDVLCTGYFGYYSLQIFSRAIRLTIEPTGLLFLHGIQLSETSFFLFFFLSWFKWKDCVLFFNASFVLMFV